jgi:hypothetical protein
MVLVCLETRNAVDKVIPALGNNARASQSWRLRLRGSFHLDLSRGSSAADDRASPLAFAFRSVGDETNLA